MAAENESSQFKPNNGVYLITFNDNQNVTFFGKCKLCINVLSKYLIVEPYDESIKMISVSFNQLMIKQKNILCVCSSVTNFVLVFKDKQICKKIFNGIQRKKTQSHELLNNEIMDIFNQQFFIPLIKATKENADLKDSVKYFISLLKPSRINEITRIVKEKEVDYFLCFTKLLPEISIIESNPSNSIVHESSDKRDLRKRKFVDYQKMGNSNEKCKSDIKNRKGKSYRQQTFGQKSKPPNPTSISNVVIKKPAFKLEQCEKPGFCTWPAERGLTRQQNPLLICRDRRLSNRFNAFIPRPNDKANCRSCSTIARERNSSIRRKSAKLNNPLWRLSGETSFVDDPSENHLEGCLPMTEEEKIEEQQRNRRNGDAELMDAEMGDGLQDDRVAPENADGEDQINQDFDDVGDGRDAGNVDDSIVAVGANNFVMDESSNPGLKRH